tara:strand:- start:41 stop:898 length:858 start_codon:yes stop_codon:yes gene_type:complete
MIKTLKYFLQSVFIYFFFILGRLIGLDLSRKIFSYIFFKIGPLFKSKKIVEKNLNIFSKQMPSINKDLIISKMWKNYGMTFIEYIFLDKFRKSEDFVSIEGESNLNDVIIGKSPAIFISGHFSNFELMSMEITKKKIKLATIYRPLNNFFLNPIMEFLRKKYICNHQIKKGINGVRDAINYLKNNHSIALMIDQRVSEGERVNFFDEPALTTTLPAQLAIKYNIPVIPVFIERNSENNFILKFYTPLKISGNDDKKNFTQKLNQILEKMIEHNPNEWIWTHNRWK